MPLIWSTFGEEFWASGMMLGESSKISRFNDRSVPLATIGGVAEAEAEFFLFEPETKGPKERVCWVRLDLVFE